MTTKQMERTLKLTSPPHVQRGPSPSLSSDKISENSEVRKYIDSYLGMGEWVMDQSVAILAATSWFERKR